VARPKIAAVPGGVQRNGGIVPGISTLLILRFVGWFIYKGLKISNKSRRRARRHPRDFSDEELEVTHGGH
jgi:hypothetical protein